MICVTGDTHGDLSRLKNANVKRLKKNDALIICGDFGFIWDGGDAEKKALKQLGKHKFNILFVDGVHENFAELEKYPVEEWCGGKTRLISGNLRQLMRGQIFEIDGKRIFTFGGGQAEESDYYLEGLRADEVGSPELPTDEELSEGRKNLSDCGNKVDYIVSYEPPMLMTEFLALGTTDRNHVNTYLDEIREKTEFSYWFFGRHHQNKLIPPKYRALFDDVVIAE